jgi:colanic acid/amylovoran biosynthesis glycosyltransferase
VRDSVDLVIAASLQPTQLGAIHVYVCTSYPSYSETFVATEMDEVVAQGDRVLVYSLRRPPDELPRIHRYIRRPRARGTLILWFLPGLIELAVGLTRGLRFELSSFPRVLWGAAHAARLRRALATETNLQGQWIVLHAHFLDRPADVVALQRRPRTVKLVTAHASDAMPLGDLKLRAWRVNSFARIICASRYVRDLLVSDFPRIETPVVHCGVRVPSRPKPPPPAGARSIRCCTIGRLEPTKGYPYAAAALAAVHERGVEIIWDVIGEGTLKPWLREQEAARRGTGFSINLCGALPHAAALDRLASADLFILPSSKSPEQARRGDGIPVALIEAMAAGVVVASLPVYGIPELITGGRTGIMGDPANPEDCAMKILATFTDSTRMAALIDHAFEHVRSSFNASRSAADVVAIARDVLLDARASGS